jgi:diamine N-acetyltransferase
MTSITSSMLAADPGRLTRQLDWTPEDIFCRLLQRDDAPLLGRYLEGLSEATRQLYAPHGFDQATASRLCAELDYAQTLRFVAEIRGNAGSEFAAYFILGLGLGASERRRYAERGQPLIPETSCWLAPSVADRYQSCGLGSLMLPPILEVARALGRTHMILSGGTQARNARAICFYEKFGFRRMGDFEVRELNNHDMLLELA